MTWIEATCNLYGASYSPILAEKLTKLSFVEQNEPGELGSLGRYKGKAIPYGSSTLTPLRQPTKRDPDYGIEWLADTVAKNRSQLEAAGATEITIRLNVYHDGQCNLEFPHKVLKKLADSSVALVMSCYEDSDYIIRKGSS